MLTWRWCRRRKCGWCTKEVRSKVACGTLFIASYAEVAGGSGESDDGFPRWRFWSAEGLHVIPANNGWGEHEGRVIRIHRRCCLLSVFRIMFSWVCSTFSIRVFRCVVFGIIIVWSMNKKMVGVLWCGREAKQGCLWMCWEVEVIVWMWCG